jgi:hypothetical protein
VESEIDHYVDVRPAVQDVLIVRNQSRQLGNAQTTLARSTRGILRIQHLKEKFSDILTLKSPVTIIPTFCFNTQKFYFLPTSIFMGYGFSE